MTLVLSSRVSARDVVARAAYASLFMVGLPVLLVAWAVRLDTWLRLPSIDVPVLGSGLALAGLALMGAGMRALWVRGSGLPASPFPPARLVTGGVYRFTADPIYVGAIFTSFGISLLTSSAAGLWIVSPTLALAAAAFVMGFERDATRRRYGSVVTPLLRLPSEGAEQPTRRDRGSIYLLVFLPWFVLYQAVETLGVAPDATDAHFEWEAHLPVLAWSEAIYAGTYVFVLAVPLVAKRLEDLRAFGRGGLWATALIIPLYLLVPLIAPARLVAGEGFWQTMMNWERVFDQPVTAFPAFHVVWACLAAQVWTATLPRLRSVWWALAVSIGASCVTTGMHAVADVGAGFVAYRVVAKRLALWRQFCSGAESIANAWKEVSIGPARLLLHGGFIALGAVVGFAIAIHLAGPDQAGWILAMTCASVIGAAVWAQLIEGSSQLLRPYGYFGSVIGAAAVAVIGAVAGLDGWHVFTAFGVGGAFTQAIGRLRCLTQGCCHGRPAVASIGIRHTNPHSRVVRFTDFAGVPLHPTPVYSLIWMLLVGATLLRLWALAAPLPLIAGSYFILTGIGRFVEEHYRGEPQTPTHYGLRLYQWLAIAFVIGGAVLTTLGANPAPATHRLDASIVPTLLIVAALTFAAYGVDFPQSSRRFSRLA